MSEVFKVGLIGCGTVGQGVVRMLREEGEAIERRTGIRVELARVVDKDASQPRRANVPEELVSDDAADILTDTSISAVVELVGGTTAAKRFVLESLRSGKHVVTANKALLARHAAEIYRVARENNTCVAFEASCAGGIPLILSLRTGLIANRISAMYGILNGTCNYILSEMDQKGKSYAVALREAQDAGYAELDPTLDVGGGDTAHKLAILASLAFACNVDFDRIHVEGIEHLDARDLAAGRELGYVCKLLGIADLTDAGLSLRVHPSFVHADHPLATTPGSFNAVSLYGNWVGHTLYYGRGAGQKPTASAVVGDLIDIAAGNAQRTFSQFPVLNDLTHAPKYAPMDGLHMRFYVRLIVADEPGVMAQLTRVFGDRGISLSAITQREPQGGAAHDDASVVVLTGDAEEGKMRAALDEISQLPSVHAEPIMIRVVEEHEEYSP